MCTGKPLDSNIRLQRCGPEVSVQGSHERSRDLESLEHLFLWPWGPLSLSFLGLGHGHPHNSLGSWGLGSVPSPTMAPGCMILDKPLSLLVHMLCGLWGPL